MANMLFTAATALSKEHSCPNKLKFIIITCGGDGVKLVVRKQTELKHFPVVKVDHIVSAIGAGDSFSGGLVSGIYKQITKKNSEKDEIKVVEFGIQSGIKCSAKTIMSMKSISPEINGSILEA